MVQRLPLWAKLALAVISGSSYAWVAWLILELDEWRGTNLQESAWSARTIAAIVFGVLVMGPHVAASRYRWLRITAMCVASAVIYAVAVEFVAEGPFGYPSITPFLISGASAALLVGLSVVVLAPRKASWRLFALCLVAGVIGGAAFDESIWLGADFAGIGGHLVWQLLACLALHLGLRPAPT